MTTATDCGPAPLVSLVLPVFNVAPYIRECLESIVGQTFSRPCEAILVDDGSTDDSFAICREFEERYPEIFVLIRCETNAGVSTARNLGLERARGTFLVFVDPDDVLPEQALDRLVEAAEKHGADIVKGNLVLFSESSEKPAPDRVHAERVVSGEDVLEALYEHSEVRGHIGGKLFRREILGALRFQTGVRMAQDLLYFSEVFARARSLALIADVVYRYRKHSSGSTGRKYEKGSYRDWLDAVERAGQYASTAQQRRAHKRLLLRTLTQIARETREISAQFASAVLEEIERRMADWDLNLPSLLIRDRLGTRSLLRYLKLRLALARIRRKLKRS